VEPPLRLGADLAWCGPALREVAPVRRLPRHGAGRRLGVAISHLAGRDAAALAARMAAAVVPLAADGWRIELEPWQGPGRLGADALLAHDLARRIGAAAEVVPPPPDLAEAARRTAARDLVVALRFHAAVVAAATGTPLVAIAHEPKLAAVADRVRQPWVAVDHLGEELPVAVAAALGSAGPDAAAVHAERQRSAATLELLRLVLAGGGEPVGLEHLGLVPDPVPT
jgi:polysaccharide pyruvyl transferase WcaK-like protein